MKQIKKLFKPYKDALPVIKYFFSFVWKDHKSFFIMKSIYTVYCGLTPFVSVFLTKFFIDELMDKKRIEYLVAYISILALSTFLLSILDGMFNKVVADINTQINNDLSQKLCNKVITMDYGFTEDPDMLTARERAGTGISWYSQGVMGIANNIGAIISGIITVIGTVAIISTLSWWLLLLLIAIIVINFFIDSKINRSEIKFTKEAVGINRKFGYYFFNLSDVSYGKDVRFYNGNEMVYGRVMKYIGEYEEAVLKKIKYECKYRKFISLVNAVQQTVLYAYIGVQVLSKLITVGEFQMYIQSSFKFTQMIKGILFNTLEITKNTDFLRDYMTFVEKEDTISWGYEKAKNIKHVYEFRNVSFKYPKTDNYILKNVSFKINDGEKISIVGKNGSGKTTIVKLLLRFYDIDEGEILLDGINIKNYDKEEYMKVFSCIFQDFNILSLSVAENISGSEEYDENRIYDALEKSGAAEFVNKYEKGIETQLNKIIYEDGVALSGGENQKVAIARAIYKKSPMIILDEPTSALDPLAEYEIYNTLHNLIGERTAIYISHRLSSCRFSDKILVFDGGKLIEQGTHDELVKEDKLYRKMWSAQAKYYV